ncbi:MAG: replicative helicase loader/inhibitor [Lachnospiraceae bacterium]|nr:replicative helicase loader/inhibitor [Lachnospiraceae bacterium]
MAVLKTAYPNYYKNSGDLEQAAKLWAELFADDDVLVVAAAVKAFIANDEKGFPPVIGQIKAMVRDLASPKEMTELEAWDIVNKALRNSLYNHVEEYEKLPPVIRRIVGSPATLHEWAQSNLDELQTVIASNFQRSYRAKAKGEREFMAFPQSTKDFLSQLAGKMDLENALEGGKQEQPPSEPKSD